MLWSEKNILTLQRIVLRILSRTWPSHYTTELSRFLAEMAISLFVSLTECQVLKAYRDMEVKSKVYSVAS